MEFHHFFLTAVSFRVLIGFFKSRFIKSPPGGRPPELLSSQRYKPVTAGMEMGGRWGETAYDFLLELARTKAEEAPRLFWGLATNGWLRRWTSLLSKAGMDSVAETLLHGTAQTANVWNGVEPPLGAVLCGDAAPPQCSRLGLR